MAMRGAAIRRPEQRTSRGARPARCQTSGVPGLVWFDSARLTGVEPPAGYLAFRSNELTNGEGSVDVLSNLAFARRLNCEQRAQLHISASPR
jgi:hypothetical protein